MHRIPLEVVEARSAYMEYRSALARAHVDADDMTEYDDRFWSLPIATRVVRYRRVVEVLAWSTDLSILRRTLLEDVKEKLFWEQRAANQTAYENFRRGL